MAKSKNISNKTEASRIACTLIKRASPRLKAKRDALNISQKSAARKSGSDKRKSCVEIINTQEFEESSKSQKLSDSTLTRSCNKNMNISAEKISTRNSTANDQTSLRKRKNTIPISKKKKGSMLTNKKIKAKDKIKISKKILPTKGTLKRKRYIIDVLKERSDEYEDDIFESSKCDKFKETLFLNDSDTSIMNIATPKYAFLVSPRRPAKTPCSRFKDIYSPMELMKARKAAEEYMHLRNKRKLHSTPVSESEKENVDSEKKKLEFISIAKSLNKEKDKSEDSDEDIYFSDAA